VRNNKAFGIIEVLIAVSIVTVLIMGLTAVNFRTFNVSDQGVARAHFQLAMRNFSSLVLDARSWQQTLIQNSIGGTFNAGQMDCLRNSTSCAVVDQLFALVDAAGNVFYDATSPTAGFTRFGIPCNSFTANGEPVGDCIFRYELRWTAVCTPPNCINPPVRVSARLIRNSQAQGFPLNLNLYSILGIMR
jgi:competence protein ComGC